MSGLNVPTTRAVSPQCVRYNVSNNNYKLERFEASRWLPIVWRDVNVIGFLERSIKCE